MRRILIDSGILLSYYQQQEPLHQAVVVFFDQNVAQLITSQTSPWCPSQSGWTSPRSSLSMATSMSIGTSGGSLSAELPCHEPWQQAL